MSPKQAVGIDFHARAVGQRTYAKRNVALLSRLDDRSQLFRRRRENRVADRGKAFDAARKGIRCLAAFSFFFEEPQRVQAHFSQRIREIEKPKILNAASFRILRTFDRDPLDLRDEQPGFRRDQRVFVDSRKRPRDAGVKRDVVWRFDVEENLNFVRRNKVDASDSQRFDVRDRRKRHWSPSLFPLWLDLP